MRVIAGTAKGRRLKAPPGERVRPTTDRVKEALFSSLQPYLLDAVVLDVYAGSGALGIEALSRGAAHVTFVERHARTAAVLEENLVAAGVTDRAEVVVADVLDALRRVSAGPFDLVLADPPYATSDDEIAALLAEVGPHLADDAIITVERDRRAAVPAWPKGVSLDRTRRYGDTCVHVARSDP